MARQLRVEFPGAIYHVTVRIVGEAWHERDEPNPAACLFRDDNERERFLAQLAERVDTFSIRIYAYCLMLSHYHLFLETPQGNLGRFMHSLNTAYTVYSNLRRQRHGHLVGRYKAKLVEGDTYLLALSRYIHLNPVRVRAMAKRTIDEQRAYLAAYPWSSYLAYIGKEKTPDWIACGPALAMFGHGKSGQRRRYRQFVERSLSERDEELQNLLKESTYGIGGEEFRDWVREQMIEAAQRSNHPEDISLRRQERALSPEDVLAAAADVLGVDQSAFSERRRNSVLRGVAARALGKYAGLTQRQTAMVLGIGTGAAIGRQLRRLEEIVEIDRSLCRKLHALDAVLSEAAGLKY